MLPVIALEGLLERPHEVEQRDLAEIQIPLLLLGGNRQWLGLARPDAHAHPVHLGHRLSDLLEAAVFEQPLDQLLARILLGLAGVARRPRQEHLGLEVDQQRRLVDVLAGDVEVQLFHQLQIGVELVADRGHRDVGDLHPVELDEVQQQVERPLEDRQVDLPGLGQGALLALGGRCREIRRLVAHPPTFSAVWRTLL